MAQYPTTLLTLYISYSKCMIVPVVTTPPPPQKMGELKSFPMYILSKDSVQTIVFEKQCQYSSLLSAW